MKRLILAAAFAGVVLAAWTGVRARHRAKDSLQVRARGGALPADGRFHAASSLLMLHGSHVEPALVAATGLPARVVRNGRGEVELYVQAPILPGERGVQVAYKGRTTQLNLSFVPSMEDTIGDGTPDFLRLHTQEDRNAFRQWFTAMADAAADLPAEQLPHEVRDCAALLRWCYRNALHAHDDTWLGAAPDTLHMSAPSVKQYAYPATPLGAALLRVHGGPFAAGDETDGTFAQFADARTLWRWNTFSIGRDVHTARPGDLLFFRQLEQNSPFHSMIVVGTAQQTVVYHTGPIGNSTLR